MFILYIVFFSTSRDGFTGEENNNLLDYQRNTENPESKGTQRDQDQLQAPQSTTLNSNPVLECCPNTLWALASRGHVHHPLVKNFFLIASWQLHAIPSGPVAVTESRAQCCPSAPCEELQPPWGLWVSSSPGWTNQGTSTVPHVFPDLSPFSQSSSGCSHIVLCLLHEIKIQIGEKKTMLTYP